MWSGPVTLKEDCRHKRNLLVPNECWKTRVLYFFNSVSFYILIINVIDLRKKITTTCILVFLCKILIEIRNVMNVMYVIIMIGITIA